MFFILWGKKLSFFKSDKIRQGNKYHNLILNTLKLIEFEGEHLLKIKFNQNNEKIQNQNNPFKEINSKLETIEMTRPFAEIIRMEGIQAGNIIAAKSTIKNITYYKITSKILSISGNIDVKTDRYTQKNSSSNIKLKWDKTLNIIPELQKSICLNTTLKIPQDKPEIGQIKTIKPKIKHIQVNTLLNRLVVKGEAVFKIKYIGH